MLEVTIPKFGDVQFSLSDSMYKFIPVRVTQCKLNEHKYFINNMECRKVLDLFKNITEQVELKEINKMNEDLVFDKNDEQQYFIQLIQESDLRNMSVFMANGFKITQKYYYDGYIEVEETNTYSIKKLEDLSFHEFISMYQIIQAQAKDTSRTLSDACPKYFHWRGV